MVEHDATSPERRQRLAMALRDNLRRRKARQRAAGDDDASNGAPDRGVDEAGDGDGGD